MTPDAPRTGPGGAGRATPQPDASRSGPELAHTLAQAPQQGRSQPPAAGPAGELHFLDTVAGATRHAGTRRALLLLRDRVQSLTILDDRAKRYDTGDDDWRQRQLDQLNSKIGLAWAKGTLDQQPELLLELAARSLMWYRDVRNPD